MEKKKRNLQRVERVVDLETRRAIIELPTNAVEVEITAKIYKDGRITEVKQRMDMDDIHMVCKMADEGYIDDDDKFSLTELGLQTLNDIRRNNNERDIF